MDNLVSRSRSLRGGKGAGRRAVAKEPASVVHIPDEPLHSGPENVSDQALRTSSYNGFGAPADASQNVQQYASRPLPATPTFKTKMADRPSTSGGPISRKRAKTDFRLDNRSSRDDFYVGTRVYGRTRHGSSIPFQVQLPTPGTSPKTAAAESSARGSTTYLEAETYSSDIGMALGSPSHPPIHSDTRNLRNTTQRRTSSPRIESPPISRSSSVDTFDMPVQRKPSGKWKLFSIFNRKQSGHSVQAISISDPNGLYGTNRPEEDASPASQIPPSDPRGPARSSTTNSRKTPKHKPIVVRSQTMPTDIKPDIYNRTPERSERKGDGTFGRIPIPPGAGRGSGPMTGPLLNIEIPDVRLERYSVMFDSVLNSNPSLLSRRQATVQKLKSIEDAVERDEGEKRRGMGRRVTSPQVTTDSSEAILFPTSRQAQNLAPQKLSPRLRSHTSPTFPSFYPENNPDRRKPRNRYQLDERTSGLEQSGCPPDRNEMPGIAVTTHADAIEQGAPILPPQFSNDQSNLILESPTEMEPAGHEAVTRQLWKPITYQPPPEPKWQMVSPSQKTPSTASSFTSSYRKRSPSLASSSRTHITRPSEDSNASPSLDSAGNGRDSKMTPIEISVARQIPISRQQHKLIQPPRTGQSASVSPSRKPSYSTLVRANTMSGVTAGESGRIAETKTSTPTVVHPHGLLNPHHLALAQHRKSERIILEGVDAS